MELVVNNTNNELIDTDNLDKYWSRIRTIIGEMVNSEGWKELVKDVQRQKIVLMTELLTQSSKADDIRAINNLGIKISMYDYVINLPNEYLTNADRYFKSKDKKENKK